MCVAFGDTVLATDKTYEFDEITEYIRWFFVVWLLLLCVWKKLWKWILRWATPSQFRTIYQSMFSIFFSSLFHRCFFSHLWSLDGPFWFTNLSVCWFFELSINKLCDWKMWIKYDHIMHTNRWFVLKYYAALACKCLLQFRSIFLGRLFVVFFDLFACVLFKVNFSLMDSFHL